MAFASDASYLVDGDTNDTRDVFLRTPEGEIVLVSRGLDDAPTDGPSAQPSISADGAYIAFQSSATNLTEDDSGDVTNIFLYEVATGDIAILTEGANGDSTNPAASGDGACVAFQSEATNIGNAADDNGSTSDVLVAGCGDGYPNTTVSVPYETRPIANRGWPSGYSVGDGPSTNPSISTDGQYVAFQSEAENLTPEGDNNGVSDVFVYDLADARSTRLASNDGEGDTADGASLDPSVATGGTNFGWIVALETQADDLNGYTGDTSGEGDVFLSDGDTATLISVPLEDPAANGESARPSISTDGSYVVSVKRRRSGRRGHRRLGGGLPVRGWGGSPNHAHLCRRIGRRCECS